MTASSSDSLSAGEATKRSGSNFSLSFAFLSRERRAGIAAVYAYCRAVDDAVDEADDPRAGRAELDRWRSELDRAVADPTTTQTRIGRELGETIARFGVSPAHLHAVADGCERDLSTVRYPDLPALEGYCALVASAVGLACLPVFGVSETVAGVYADRLGKALQLTNILRDLRDDAGIGRVYAPTELCAAHGVELDWLRGDGPAEAYADDGPVHHLVNDLAAAARRRFDEAATLLPRPREVRRRLVPAEIMGAVYAALLDRVEARHGRIDRGGRLRISKPRKILLAARTWRRGQRP